MDGCPVTYGSWCFLECDEGYSIVGSSSRRCVAQPGDMIGRWDGDDTQCRGKKGERERDHLNAGPRGRGSRGL